MAISESDLSVSEGVVQKEASEVAEVVSPHTDTHTRMAAIETLLSDVVAFLHYHWPAAPLLPAKPEPPAE